LKFGRSSLQRKRAGTLESADIDIGIITEAEIPASSHGDFNDKGYHSYLPHPSDLLKSAKYRIVTLVRSSLATSAKIRLDLMGTAVQSVWIQLELQDTPRRQGTRGPRGTRVLIGGLYRKWWDLSLETTALSKVREQLQTASAKVDNVVLEGDVNLNTARRYDVRYRRRCLMLAHDSTVADANMRYLKRGITFRSHGLHVREDGEAREQESILDHICVSKDLVAAVNVLTDTTTDQFPLLASVLVNKVALSTKSIEHRNFKQLDPPALLRALEAWHWSNVHRIRHPDTVLAFINQGIVHTLEEDHGQGGEAPPVLTTRHLNTNGAEGFPRPCAEVQGRQEQGHRPGQALQGANINRF
jgi:hypothetical protein